jgi:hypothetical protein
MNTGNARYVLRIIKSLKEPRMTAHIIVTQTCSTIFVSGSLNVWLRYALGSIIGALLYGLTTAPPTTVTSADHHAVIMKYKEMVQRDDRLLNVLLDSSWKRDCKYRVVPWHQLADGSIRQSILQECDDEK